MPLLPAPVTHAYCARPCVTPTCVRPCVFRAHACACVFIVSSVTEERLDVARLLMGWAVLLLEHDHYREAEPLFLCSLTMYVREAGPSQLSTWCSQS